MIELSWRQTRNKILTRVSAISPTLSDLAMRAHQRLEDAQLAQEPDYSQDLDAIESAADTDIQTAQQNQENFEEAQTSMGQEPVPEYLQ